MIHESVHAYLIYQQYANSTGNLHESLLIYQRENGYYSSGNEIHHNFMAQFINGIAYTLYRWDRNHGTTGGNLGWQYYHDMAWGGLISDENGDFWDEFINHNPDQSDQERIIDVVQDEATNSNNSSGNGQDCQ